MEGSAYTKMQSDLKKLNAEEQEYNASAPPYSIPQRPQQQQQQEMQSVVFQAPVAGNGSPAALPPAYMVNSSPSVGPESIELICPQCRCRIKTKVRHRATAKTHIACLLLSWTACCCCLPYCMDSCRNANHFCPMCGTFIGTYQS